MAGSRLAAALVTGMACDSLRSRRTGRPPKPARDIQLAALSRMRPVSWVIKTPFHKLFFSGDSDCFGDFKQIGDKYGPFDMTFIECGAYGKSWPKVHMFAEQTVQAHLNLKGNVLHPIHWATFNLALHPWYEPMMRLTAAANFKNVNIATPVAGETTVYGSYIRATRWWKPAMELAGGIINTAVIEKEL